MTSAVMVVTTTTTRITTMTTTDGIATMIRTWMKTTRKTAIGVKATILAITVPALNKGLSESRKRMIGQLTRLRPLPS